MNIFYRLKKAFEIPFNPADEETNRDAVISVLLNITLLVVMAYLFPFTLSRGLSSPQVGVMWFAFIFFLALRLAANKGHVKAVSFTLLISLWFFVIYEFLGFENGLRAPAYTAALAFVIVYAGLLHGQRVVWVIAGFSILLNIIITLGEMNGFFFIEPKMPDIRWALFGQIIFFSGIIFMLNKTLRNLSESISLNRKESKNRLEAELSVRQLNKELETAYETTLEGWAQALELRDKETEGHSRRVTNMSMELARQLGLGEEEIKHIYYGALLHDIGKMGVPDEILNKPGPLTSEERKIVQQHPIYAYNMLKKIKYLQKAIVIPYSHHEYWDGTGYPQGLKCEAIPIFARIFSIVDNWDALISDRPYRSAWPREKVIKFIQAESGKMFDPKIAELFLGQITAN